MLLVLVLGLALTACGDDNGGMGLSPPSVTGSVENQSLVADQSPVEIDAGSLFEGQELTLSASSSDSSVVAISLSEGTLTVDPQNGGSGTTITVTAENDAGSAETTFDVDVNLPVGPGPPNGS